jgi:peptide methionine sulfoxide reductase msrA/msrB
MKIKLLVILLLASACVCTVRAQVMANAKNESSMMKYAASSRQTKIKTTSSLINIKNNTNLNKTNATIMKERSEIYLAGGCFWGTEHFLKMINGVVGTEVGYANGHTEDPTYKEVCTHTTGFAETVHVTYDPHTLALSTLLELYFKTIDPTSVDRQGGDVGDQYRTGIFYTDKEDLPKIEEEVKRLSESYSAPIAIQVLPLKNFYKAEEYHQDYLDKNPTGYCHIPQALFELAKKANR